jgi:hypothetical protein
VSCVGSVELAGFVVRRAYAFTDKDFVLCSICEHCTTLRGSGQGKSGGGGLGEAVVRRVSWTRRVRRASTLFLSPMVREWASCVKRR